MFYLPEAGYFYGSFMLFLIFCIAPVFKGESLGTIVSSFAGEARFWDAAPEYFCIEQFCLNSIFFVSGMWVVRKIMDRASDIPVFYSLDCNTIGFDHI